MSKFREDFHDLLGVCKRIEEDRFEKYGGFDYNCKKFAEHWSRVLGGETKIEDYHAAHMMFILKLERIYAAPDDLDSYLDAVNYLLFTIVLRRNSNGYKSNAVVSHSVSPGDTIRGMDTE